MMIRLLWTISFALTVAYFVQENIQKRTLSQKLVVVVFCFKIKSMISGHPMDYLKK